jgi:hypothetical protein
MRWMLFILGKDKTPLPNCGECRDADASHNREACTHLFCHGFYAATDDYERFNRMRALQPDGYVALRTGQSSGIVVLDAEGHGEPSGIEVLDDWENWSGGWPLAATGRIANTPSGGVHRYYLWQPGIRSRNRVLPGIDVKSDGGYVVVPFPGTEPSRSWQADGEPGELGGEMLQWFRAARGRNALGGASAVGHGEGYDYLRFVRDGCPGGMRDEFFNELIFRMRKSGASLQAIHTEAHRQWKKAAQPPDATYYMPYHHVQYKIKRIWGTVEVDDVQPELQAWAESQRSGPVSVGRAGAMVKRTDAWAE